MKNKTIKEIQKAILSNKKTYKTISLPKIQSGTSKQKESYAFLKSVKIYEIHFSNPFHIKRENKEQLFQRLLNNFETL